MDKKLRREMMQRELRGIDLELEVARKAHIRDTQAIVDLERERNEIAQDAWFTSYMQGRYGTWENAKTFWLAHNWW